MSSPRKIREIWKVQRQVFGGHGKPKEAFKSKLAGLGLVDEKKIEDPGYERTIVPFQGEKVGEYIIDYDKKEVQYKKE